MRKAYCRAALFSLGLAVLAVWPAEVGAENAAASGKAVAEAAALTEEGWDILTRPRFSAADPLWYEETCDRPEAAGMRFRRAAELDPTNAAAWRGWGRSIEQFGPCRGAASPTWAQKHGLDPLWDEPPRVGEPRPAVPLNVLVEAEEKFRKAAELAPLDSGIWADRGSNLLRRAALEKDASRRREMIAEASEYFNRVIELKPNDPEIWQAWGRRLFEAAVSEDDPARWSALLAEAEKCWGRSVDLFPSSSPDAVDPVPRRKIEAWRVLSALQASAGFQPGISPEKRLALREAALKSQERILDVMPKSTEALREAARLNLELAELYTAENDWRARLARAVELYELARPLKRGLYYAHRGRTGRGWLDTARRVDDPAKRRAIALAAWHISESLEKERESQKDGRDPVFGILRTQLMLGQSIYEQSTCDLGPLLPERFDPAGSKYPTGRFMMMMEVAALLPDGPEREAMIAEAEAGFTKLYDSADRSSKAGILTDWGLVLLLPASSEPRMGQAPPGRYQALIARSAENLRQAVEESVDRRMTRLRQAEATARLSRAERVSDRKRRLLLAAAEGYEQVLGFGDRRADRAALAAIYYQLAQLESEHSPDRRSLTARALDQYFKAAETPEREGRVNSDDSDLYFTLAQVLTTEAANRGSQDWLELDRPGRQLLGEAMGFYRRHFFLLPLRNERGSSGGRSSSSGHRSTDEILNEVDIFVRNRPKPVRPHLTGQAAREVRQIYQAGDFNRMKAWEFSQLAGLYRHLAASDMLSPAYSRFYRQKAEDLLRRILNWKEQVRLSDGAYWDWYLQSPDQPGLTRSELGLLLAERTLAEPGRKAADLREAEDLWREAEELRPGSSLYARARWAAWRGDVPAMKEHLRRLRMEKEKSGAWLSPDFEVAVDDPALADYVNEPWFRRAWFGFDREPGPASVGKK